jgi:hypothetical protein
MSPTYHAVPDRNREISSQVEDAAKVEELSNKVRISYGSGFMISYYEVSLIYISTLRGRNLIVFTALKDKWPQHVI